MLELMFLVCFTTICALKIGHLSSNYRDTTALLECTANTSIHVITLPACDKFNGVENSAALRYKYNISTILGVDCEEEAQTVARLAERWGILFITTTLTEKLANTTMTADPLNPRGFAGAIVALAETVGWKDIGIVCHIINCKFHHSLKQEITSLSRLNVSSVQEMKGKQWKYAMASTTRVIFFFLNYQEFPAAVYRFQKEISHSEEFVFVLIELQRVKPQLIVENLKESLYEKEVSHKQVTKLLRRVVIKTKIGLLCDTLQLINNQAINDTVISKTSIGNKRRYDHTFFSRDGYRMPFLEVFGVLDGQMARAGQIEPFETLCLEEPCIYHKFIRSSVWDNIADHLRVPQPECGYDGQSCSYLFFYIGGAVVALIILIPLSLMVHFQIKEARLLRMIWRVDHDQLSFKKGEDLNPGYRRISTASSGKMENEETDFAYLNNEKVFVKSFSQKRSVTFSRKEMARLNQLKYLNHVNVNSFVGIVFNSNSHLIVLWTFCARGSLDDIIFNGGRELGRDFKALFIKQILNGLQYIHKGPIKMHGALFLTNCVVDNYWVLKLTDFGLAGILNHKMEQKEIVSNPSIEVGSMSRSYLQYPPEYLSVLSVTGEPMRLTKTVAGDVYQLGMLIYQILLTRRPFRERSEDVADILGKICDFQRETPFRPLVPEPTEYTMRMISVMQQCWQSNADLRPQLYKIVDAVAREFSSSEKSGIVDHMIKMIDEYSANLEDIVAKRTESLTLLQQNTEELLFRMMPRTIAEEIRDGTEIKPRMHDGVALLVADLWRFSNLCRELIPVQVVTILHQIYQHLDKILDNYAALKIENVGDTYLVVAGIPKEPENRQLETICRVALQFKEYIGNFVPEQKADLKIMIKFGLHCGDVASGIIGHRTPRYCVFGDAVAMTYRMAETSYPNKIQMTESMYNTVTAYFPKFVASQRGVVDIKQKGPCTTYLLESEKTSKQASPDPFTVD